MADIFFKCDSCGKDLVVDDVGAGAKTKCHNCIASVVIPKIVVSSTCPYCGRELKFTGDMKGLHIQCSVCESEIVLDDRLGLPAKNPLVIAQSRGTVSEPTGESSTVAGLMLFKCLNCGKHLIADDKEGGCDGLCPLCKKKIIVPRRGISTSCGKCGRSLTISDRLAGEEFICPKCRSVFPAIETGQFKKRKSGLVYTLTPATGDDQQQPNDLLIPARVRPDVPWLKIFGAAAGCVLGIVGVYYVFFEGWIFAVIPFAIIGWLIWYPLAKNFQVARLARTAPEQLAWGASNSVMVCPHCHAKGTVRTKQVSRKAGISGGKATGALLTGGISLLATGLSRKEQRTQAHCSACNSTWLF